MGKPETITTESVEAIDEQLGDKLGQVDCTDWERFCTRENAERAREDVEQILEILHTAAKPRLKNGLGPLQPGLQSHSAFYKPEPPR